ncbi:hypothetical protein GNX71_02045 [Variovorax sp. RKNM96]|nr:hypothetical protein GNX71_02045 [Variovorax sp. RKNM96]
MSDTDIQVVSSSWAGIQRVAAIPKPPEFFKGRKGYEPGFFGGDNRVELPSMGDAIDMDDIATLDDGSFELRYQHFSTVQCISRRVPLYSACNIDGSKSKNVPRHDTWNYDGRIRKEYQMLREAYGPEQEQKFSRGHMTRRQDPNWGSLATAQRANIDTFFATNACPQWQPFNDGLWGDLEDYILGNAQGDDKRISVFTGPILRADDPERFGIRIPRDFWKVVAFISEATGELSAIAYLMSQARTSIRAWRATWKISALRSVRSHSSRRRPGSASKAWKGATCSTGRTSRSSSPSGASPTRSCRPERLRSGRSAAQGLDQVDVLLLGLVAARALLGGPGVPLGARDDVAEAGLLGGVVAFGGLLEEAVDLQQRGVVGALGQQLGVGLGGFELGVEVGHGGWIHRKTKRESRILSCAVHARTGRGLTQSRRPARASSTSSRSRASAGSIAAAFS